jgi:hypothetical protein
MEFHSGCSNSHLPSLRSGCHLEVSFTLSLVRGNDCWAAVARDNGASTIITALTGSFLEFSRDVDCQDWGNESGDESEFHDECIA